MLKKRPRFPDYIFAGFYPTFQGRSFHLLFGISLFAIICNISGCGGSSTSTVTKTPPTLAITTSSLPNGQVGVAYSTSLAATGGAAPYTWSLASGTLPAGLSLNTSTGAITGTPTATASAIALTFKVTDSGSPAQSQTVNLTLTIGASAPPALAITTTSLPAGVVGAAYAATLAASGGTTPYTWSLTSGTLPAGLSLNTSTGAITGTPTATASATALTFKVTDSGSPAQSQTVNLTLTISASAPPALAITTTSLPNGQVGVAYSTSLAATGGTTPYTWSLTSGTLPAGLSLNTSTGAITGTPTATASATALTFKVTDSGSPAQSKTVNLTLTISAAAPPALVITTASLPNGEVGDAYSTNLAATGGTPPYTWSLTSGTLPAGLSLTPATGAISGTPTATANAIALTFSVTDSGSPAQTRSANLMLTVQAPTITGVSPSPVTASGSPQSLTIYGTGFESGATVTYEDPQGNTSAGHATTFVGASQIVDDAFNNNNASGNWTVTVVDPNNVSSNTYVFAVAPAESFTVVQHSTSTCASSPCADAITSTTAGNLLVLWSAATYSGTGSSAIAQGFTAASGDSSWTHCPNQIVNYIDGVSTANALDCWYILSATGGATSVSATWTFAGLTAPTYAIADELFELQPSSTPVYYDTGNASNNLTDCSTTCTGPAALLSSTDAVLQATKLSSLPTGISSPYAVPDVLSNVNGAFSSAMDQSSYSQPTWEGTFSSNPNFYSTAAFGNNSSPTKTLDYLIDFSACTAGSAPTSSCLSNSTFTGALQTTPYVGEIGPNLIVTNSGPSSLLPFSPTIFNGSPMTGASTLNLGCTTDGSTQSCGLIEAGVEMVPTSTSIGYTVESSCPATGVDCGSIGGILSKGGALDYEVVHFSPLGNGKICFDTQGGSGCAGQTTLAYSPNTAYRVNMQINNYPAPANYITVCADGPGGAVLGTWSSGVVAANVVDDVLGLGITGQEPPVSGYTYSWRNVVLSFTGQFSTTSCF
jgi:hypothetical protein